MHSPGTNKAIEAAAAAGGGTVYLPAGSNLSGAIHLKEVDRLANGNTVICNR